jgi:serine/threonine-protein kinase
MSEPESLSNRYELGETLGYGGMSEVHRGHDARLGRDVAVKVLRADLARDPTFQERFRREAQNAAALNHAAIVAVYDTGEAATGAGTLPYIVMEYVDGRTLRDVIKTEGPLSEQRACEIMADICAALDFSHRNGIVHRDMKPGNVMLTRSGAVKVMDFGIARALTDGQSAVTQTAAVIGTAQYLSPEQARGESVDARSDVYSAGCVLFEMLAGEPPFTGESPVAVAYQHVREDPRPPSELNPQVTGRLDAIVLQALSKNPANRYQSAAEMRADVVRVLAGQRPSAPAVLPAGELPDDADDEQEPDDNRRRRRRGWTAAGLVVLFLGVVALAAWLVTSQIGAGGGHQVAVPYVKGATADAARAQLRQSGLKVNERPVRCQVPVSGGQAPCGSGDIGKVLRTDPRAGTQIAKSTVVQLYVGAQPQQVKVPSDLAGKSPSDVTRQLRNLGLRVAQNQQMKEVPKKDLWGKVVSTDPRAGTQVDKGSSVTLTVGKQPAEIDVPDVTGEPFDKAKGNLSGLGFDVSKKTQDSAKKKGTVIDQFPDAHSKASPSQQVQLTVSNGSQLTMPKLTGMSLGEAKHKLDGTGFTGTVAIEPKQVDDPTKRNQVLSTNPSKGDSFNKDGTVTLTVGKLLPSFPSQGGGGNSGGGNSGGGNSGGIGGNHGGIGG